MEENDNIALFDMDDSLARYTKALVRDLCAMRSPHEPEINEENVWFFDLEANPWLRKRMDLIKRQPGWWFDLEPIEEGFDVLEWAARFGFQIHILTKGPKKHPTAWKEKVEWCQRHIDVDVDVHITADKRLVYGKVLFDDHPDYLLRWLAHRPRGLGIMPVTPSNKDFLHPNVVRYNGLPDLGRVFSAMQVALRREPGQPLILEA